MAVALKLTDYLKELGITIDEDNIDKISYETLSKIFQDNSITTSSEINNIKLISVKKWGKQVKDKADELKLSMYAIVTDDELGIAGVINKRFALMASLLSKLGEDLNTLKITKIEDTRIQKLIDSNETAEPTPIYENEYNETSGEINSVDKTSLYKFYLDYNGLVKVWNSLVSNINTLTTNLQNEVTRATAKESEIESNVSTNTTNITAEVERAKAKESELETSITNQFNTANTYTDTKVTALEKVVDDLTNGAPETLDTFKEIADKLEAVDKQITEFEEDHEGFINDINNLTTTTKIDDTTTAVACTLTNNYDYTYKADNISSITVTIPSSTEHGFACGFNFHTGDSYPAFSIVNNSSYDLKIILNGVPSDDGTVTLKANRIYTCICLCNGIGVIFQIVEMEK